MCDQGINPQALAQVVKFLRKEGANGNTSDNAGAAEQ